MLDVHVGRPPRRRLPGRHADGHRLLLRRERRRPCATIPRRRRADPAAWTVRRAVRLQRQVHPAALRQHLAAADPEAAPAGLDPGRRQRRDVGLVRRERLPLRLPVLLRLPAGAEDRWTASGRRSTSTASTGTRTAPASCSSSASPTATREAEELYAEPAPVLLQPLPAHRIPASLQPPGYRHRRRRSGRGMPSQMKETAQTFEDDLTWKDIVERGYIIAGSADTVADRLKDIGRQAQRRPPVR